MIKWEMKELNENEIPECNTPNDIISYVMTISSHVMPNVQPEIKGFDEMNGYQTAYALAKVIYEQFDQMAEDETKRECGMLGIVLKRGDKQSLDQWSQIDTKYEKEFHIYELMHLKWQSEQMLVNYMFNALDNADDKIKEKYTNDMGKYNYIKTNWQHPAVRKQVIELAFKFKLN